MRLINGGVAVDDRGQLTFANEFNFENVKRFYMVENHRQGFIRAWHGHKKEAKYAFVCSGSALVCTVKVDNWENPSKNLDINRIVISSKNPKILYIPAGYANGFMSLTNDTKIIFFSSSTLEESAGDDYRFESRYWDPWHIEER